jgi:2-polyprenyl-3-methyl-5-hydroxy-6-metoxy-1,4-benzoquinol methylase
MKRLSFYLKYLGNPPWDTGISPPELVDFIHSRPAGRALDLGCGTGTNSLTLAQAGWQVTAVDFVSRAVKTARRKAEQAGVKIDFRVQDVTRLDNTKGPYDLILDIGCFHSLSQPSKQAYMDHISRLIAPQGAYLLYAFIDQGIDQNAAGVPGLTGADLTALTSRLDLIVRKDGMERNSRPSAWFTFRSPMKRESTPVHSQPRAG